MNRLRKTLLLFVSRICLKIVESTIIAVARNAQAENVKTSGELPTTPTLPKLPAGLGDSVTMMQNQHLAGILLAMGCPPQEAEIRSEIFGFKDMPMIRDKLYFFKPSYWIDV